MTQFDDKQMILNQSRWPGDVLCLKKKPVGEEKAGVMGYSMFGVITTSKLPIVVYLRPNFALEKRYDTVDALLADGWVVD